MLRKDSTTLRRFDKLSTAVFLHKLQEVCDLIDEDPTIVLTTDESNNNIMHFAGSYCTEANAETIILLLGYLQQVNSLAILCATNTWGKTPLHVTAKFNTTLAVQKLIEALGSDAHKTARMCDNEGGLAAKYLLLQPSSDANLQNIQTLLDATYYNPFELSLTSKIDTDKTVNSYANTSEFVRSVIKFACELVNLVRDNFIHSSSHPDANKIATAKQDEINNLILLNRKNTLQKNLIATFKQTKTGNCLEFVLYAFHLLRTSKIPSIRAEFVNIKAGEAQWPHTHAFIVFNRRLGSDIANPATWEDAVVCDSWAGSVYLAREIPEKLFCHHSLSVTLQKQRIQPWNVIEIFNPHFHKLSDCTDRFFPAINKIRPDLIFQIPPPPSSPPPPAPTR